MTKEEKLKARDKHVAHMIVGFVTHALELEYWDNETGLKSVITGKLIERLRTWAATSDHIGPYLYRELIAGARLPN